MIFQFRNNRESMEKANFVISNTFKIVLDASEKLFCTESESLSERDVNQINAPHSSHSCDLNNGYNEEQNMLEPQLKYVKMCVLINIRNNLTIFQYFLK